MLSFTFDGTDTVTRRVVGASAIIVIGLLIWIVISGKLMILERIWVPFVKSDVIEQFTDTVKAAVECLSEYKDVALERIRYDVVTSRMINYLTFVTLPAS